MKIRLNEKSNYYSWQQRYWKRNCRFLKSINLDVITTSKKDLDTSKIDSVDNFKKNTSADILVMNTGGPPQKNLKK